MDGAQPKNNMPCQPPLPLLPPNDDVKQQRRCISALPRTIIAKSLPRGASADCEIAALRDVRHVHAAKVERQALIVGLAVRELLKLHERMDQEARAIAGEDYEVHHTVSFERHGYMDDQREDLGEILIPGLVDVASMVEDMAEDAK
jgi:hypothetical protein